MDYITKTDLDLALAKVNGGGGGGSGIIAYTNIPVLSTPTASSYQSWDTQHKYGYKAEITVNGITANSLILNIVMTDALLSAIAPVISTDANKLTLYTETGTALSGTIYRLDVIEE